MADPALAPDRLPASASPIQSEQVTTIRMTLSVALLTAPNANGNLRLEGPRNMVVEGMFFALRYYVHGRARRSVVQALRVIEASAGRDLVTVRLISDTAVVERDARRELVRLGATARRGAADVDAAPIELADGSRTGLGFSATAPFGVGERVWIKLPRATADAALIEVEVTRADAKEAVTYGARFVDADRGAAFFAMILDAIWTQPLHVTHDARASGAVNDAHDDSERRGGMHGRRNAA